MVAIYFGTNRNPNRKQNPTDFGRNFNEHGLAALRFGWAEVGEDLTIQSIHMAPERLDLADRPQRLGSQDIFRRVRAKMLKHARETLVFIHGYNVTFAEAMASAVKLKRNFGSRGRNVNLVVFSWPSDGSAMPYVAYWNDRQDAEASGKAFARGFLKLAEFLGGASPAEACDQRLHLVAHSMGNYLLRHALRELRREPVRLTVGYSGRPDEAADGPRRMVTTFLPRIFDEVFLMAADEDDDAFEHDHKLALLPKIASRVSVYYNRGDVAMGISDVTKAQPDRLGADGPKNPRLIPAKVTTIDCSAVVRGLFEHSYFTEDPTVADDMSRVLAGVDPGDNDLRRYDQDRRGWRLRGR